MIQLYIDGIPLSEPTYDIEIPNVTTLKASFSYHIVPEDEGQFLLDKSMYGEDEVHEYTITTDNQMWGFDGVISNYKLIHDDINFPVGYYGMFVEIDLCGKFKYSRCGKLIIERDFTNPWKKGEQEYRKILKEYIEKKGLSEE